MTTNPVIGFVLFTALLVAGGSLGRGEERPNVLLIFTDDHAQWAVGAYGNKDVHTPNIDRLASEGVRFTQGFTKPVCSPSRAMLLTGQYSHRLGIADFIPYGNPVHVDTGLPAGTPTIASMLKAAGYKTGMVGKWHLGYGERYYPENYGFESAVGFRYVAPGESIDNVGMIPFRVGEEPVRGFTRDERHTDILADQAIRFLKDRAQEGTAPFFLYFALYRPHLPWSFVPEEDAAHYQDKEVALPDFESFGEVKATQEQLQKLMRQYYANVTCADRNIGRVLDVLDETGLAKNTLVVFIGDNGFMVGQSAMLGKGNARRLELDDKGRILRNSTRPNMLDYSVKVPFIIGGPGLRRAGEVSDALVSTLDILPTVAELTGVEAPSRIDGRSLLPLLKGREDRAWRDAYFDTYDMLYLGDEGEVPYMRMLRTDDWKLVLYQDENGRSLDGGSRHQLFDLKNDPQERRNLFGSSSYHEIQTDLENRLRAEMRRTGVANAR